MAVRVRDTAGQPLEGVFVRYYRESSVGFPEDEVGQTDDGGCKA